MIVDCFIFYNELDILKKRLRYLDSVVDKFVLVESTVRIEEKKKNYSTTKIKKNLRNGRIKLYM